MARVLQLRRGTTAENELFTGAVGELTMDTTTNQLRIHDGSTVGGHIIANDKLDVDAGNATSATKETIVGWGMPDYSAGVSKPWNTSIQAEKDGWVYIDGQTSSSAYSAYRLSLSTDGVTFSVDIANLYTGTSVGRGRILVPISKGIYYKATEGAQTHTLIFYPCIGV